MGPQQAGASGKCPNGFDDMLQSLYNPSSATGAAAAVGSQLPAIITEFGQNCCPVGGACEKCSALYNGTAQGYDHAILSVAEKYNVSWLPWAWRPAAAGAGGGKKCEDLNGGDDPAGLSLLHVPTGGS